MGQLECEPPWVTNQPNGTVGENLLGLQTDRLHIHHGAVKLKANTITFGITGGHADDPIVIAPGQVQVPIFTGKRREAKGNLQPLDGPIQGVPSGHDMTPRH